MVSLRRGPKPRYPHPSLGIPGPSPCPCIGDVAQWKSVCFACRRPWNPPPACPCPFVSPDPSLLHAGLTELRRKVLVLSPGTLSLCRNAQGPFPPLARGCRALEHFVFLPHESRGASRGEHQCWEEQLGRRAGGVQNLFCELDQQGGVYCSPRGCGTG